MHMHYDCDTMPFLLQHAETTETCSQTHFAIPPAWWCAPDVNICTLEAKPLVTSIAWNPFLHTLCLTPPFFSTFLQCHSSHWSQIQTLCSWSSSIFIDYYIWILNPTIHCLYNRLFADYDILCQHMYMEVRIISTESMLQQVIVNMNM